MRLQHLPVLTAGRLLGAGLTASKAWSRLQHLVEDDSICGELSQLQLSPAQLYSTLIEDLVAWDAAQRQPPAGHKPAAAAGRSSGAPQQAASQGQASPRPAHAATAQSSSARGSVGTSLPSERAPMPYTSAQAQPAASPAAAQPAAARHAHGEGCFLCAKDDERAAQWEIGRRMVEWTNAVNNGDSDSDDEEVSW